MKYLSIAAFLAGVAVMATAVSAREVKNPTCMGPSTEASYDFDEFIDGQTVKQLGQGDVAVKATTIKTVIFPSGKYKKVTRKAEVVAFATNNTDNDMALTLSEPGGNGDRQLVYKFKFKRSGAIVKSLKVLGAAQGGRVKVFHKNGRSKSIQIPKNNATIWVKTGVADVTRMVVKFKKGSSSVAHINVEYCDEKETPAPTVSPTSVAPTASPTESPVVAPGLSDGTTCGLGGSCEKCKNPATFWWGPVKLKCGSEPCWNDGTACLPGTSCKSCCNKAYNSLGTKCGGSPWKDGTSCLLGTTCNFCKNKATWWVSKAFTKCGSEPCWKGALCGPGTTCNSCCNGYSWEWVGFFCKS